MQEVICANCIEAMRNIEPESIDAIITDSPYGYSFLGRGWDTFDSPKDFQKFSYKWSKEGNRILKKGGLCLNFSSPRTYHRMACGVENANFFIKNFINWMYGSAIPHGLDISKEIDKYFGKYEQREVVGENPNDRECHKGKNSSYGHIGYKQYSYDPITKPYTDLAKKFDGYMTALKPANEPIAIAQKPYEDTYANNVVKYGAGAYNIGDCRTQQGRYPSNVILMQSIAKFIDQQSGDRGCSGRPNLIGHNYKNSRYFNTDLGGIFSSDNQYLDEGGASRYYVKIRDNFFYSSKANKSERNAGCENLYWERTDNSVKSISKQKFEKLPKKKRVKGNPITTLKPINLMRYLVRLFTPPDAVVLDCFAGSGTTAIACLIEDKDYIMIEKRPNFANIVIPNRLNFWEDPSNWEELKDHNALPDPNELKNQEQHKSLEMWM